MGRAEKWQIVGFGLAGACLAWRLHFRGEAFEWQDDGRSPSASRVAAGLMNPVTGKNFEPSWRIAEFMPEAFEFFQEVEEALGESFWRALPVHRLVKEKDWKKVAKKLERPDVAAWVDRVEENHGDWRAVVVLKGGGRFDVRRFCEATRERFKHRSSKLEGSTLKGRRVRCEGAAGLIAGSLGEHRCAKGEILTVEIPGQDESRILVGGGGWLVPVGGGRFKVGATYEWDELDNRPTQAGMDRVLEILRNLGVESFSMVDHEAGVRPIVRRSMPLIGNVGDEVVFNGLGSKGSLYAPGVARRLVDYLVDGVAIEEELDVAKWLEG
jgi:glycine/D-amino acid oxidase-like deaminating enzyme